MKKLLLLSCSFIAAISFSQPANIDTLAFQDFEVVPTTANPVWNFTGPVVYNTMGTSPVNAAPPSSPTGIANSRSWESTLQSGGLVLDFANVAIPNGYDSIRVHFNLAAMNLTGTSGGPDNLDYVLTEVSLDNGTTFYNRIRIRGAVANNSFWPFNALGVAKVYYQPQSEVVFAPTNTGLQTTEGYCNAEIVFPGSVTQVKIRMTGRSSTATDTWLVDNVIITGENNTISVNGISDEFNFSVYPNPSDGIIRITNDAELRITNVEIYNTLGEIVFESSVITNSSITINLSEAAKGIYFLKLETEAGLLAQKKLIIR